MNSAPAVRHFDAHGFPAQTVEIAQAHQAALGGVEDVDGAFDGELGVGEQAELVPVEGQQLVVPGDQLVRPAALPRTARRHAGELLHRRRGHDRFQPLDLLPQLHRLAPDRTVLHQIRFGHKHHSLTIKYSLAILGIERELINYADDFHVFRDYHPNV